MGDARVPRESRVFFLIKLFFVSLGISLISVAESRGTVVRGSFLGVNGLSS